MTILSKRRRRKPSKATLLKWARQEIRSAFSKSGELTLRWKPGVPGDDVDEAFDKICRRHRGVSIGSGTSTLSFVRDAQFSFKHTQDMTKAIKETQAFLKNGGFPLVRFSFDVSTRYPYRFCRRNPRKMRRVADGPAR